MVVSGEVGNRGDLREGLLIWVGLALLVLFGISGLCVGVENLYAWWLVAMRKVINH